jgi:hypothetical protein
MGHEDAFPRPRLSARCRFRKETFAGTRSSGSLAPKAAIYDGDPTLASPKEWLFSDLIIGCN